MTLVRNKCEADPFSSLLKKITTLENAERVVTLEDGIKAIARTDLEGACFDGEEKVAVEGMGLVEIQFVGPGMRVLSRCEETGETAYRDVIQQFCRHAPTYYVWCVEGHKSFLPIETTAEHPFWVKGKGWTPAIELQKGDVLENSRGAETIVWEVEPTNRENTVYNLEVEGFNTYFVGESGLWVHNCNTNGAKVWEVVKKDDATTRVLDTLVEGKSLTPNRAELWGKRKGGKGARLDLPTR